MKKNRNLTGLILLLPVVGCGAMPDIILETLRDSAKEAIEQQIDEFVDDAIDGLLEDVELPLELLDDDEEVVDEEEADRTIR